MAGPLIPFVTSQILANLRPHAPSGIAQVLPRTGLAQDFMQGIGTLGNLIRGEEPNYNLPPDYVVAHGPTQSNWAPRETGGGFLPPTESRSYVMADTGNQVAPGAGLLAEKDQYRMDPHPWRPVDYPMESVWPPPPEVPSRPDYLPPDVPWPPPPGAGGGFMPAGYGAEQSLPSAMSSVAPPVESVDQELERLAARYAEQASPPAEEEEETSDGGAVWWPRAPQADPRFVKQQQSQER